MSTTDVSVEDTLAVAVRFPELLRAAGVGVTTGNIINYVRALEVLGITQRRARYWAGRATLIWRPEDIALYDEVFAEFWLGATRTSSTLPEIVEEVPAPGEETANGTEMSNSESRRASYSKVEVIRHKNFGTCTDEELEEAYRLMDRLRFAGAPRTSRRLRRTRRHRGEFDTRRTVRHAVRHGGEIIERSFLAPVQRTRRVVLLLDISGSMEPYARALLRFGHVLVAGGHDVEVFGLGTRLTRLTRKLSARDPDISLPSAGALLVDWSGGTRLGDGLRAFNNDYAVRGLARGAVVVIVSDGWDRGDPSELDREMARLRRVAYRIIWANPWKASPGFTPSARGMAACLPYLDALMEGHSVAALAALAGEVSVARDRVPCSRRIDRRATST